MWTRQCRLCREAAFRQALTICAPYRIAYILLVARRPRDETIMTAPAGFDDLDDDLRRRRVGHHAAALLVMIGRSAKR